MRINLSAILLLSVSLACWGNTPSDCVREYHKVLFEKGLIESLYLIHPDDLAEIRSLSEKHANATIRQTQDSDNRTMADALAKSEQMTDLEYAKAVLPVYEKLQSGVISMKRSSEMVVIGEYSEADTSYVIIRWTMRQFDIAIEKLAIVPVKKHNSQYMMLLPEEVMQQFRLMVNLGGIPGHESPYSALSPPQ